MCRIFFLKSNNKEKSIKYVEAWKKASASDPYLEKTVKKFNINGIGNKHKHGWGFLFLNKEEIHIYKTIKPIYEDENFENLIKLIKKSDEFVILGLSRVTDIGYYSSIESHPFSFIAFDKDEIVEVHLAYNGLINHSEISKDFNLNDEIFENRNTLLALLSALIEKKGDLINNLVEFKKYAKSGYNLFSILIYPKAIKAFIMAYAKPELLKDKTLFNYYSVAKKFDKDLIFAGNKLIAEYLEEEGERGFELMKNGEYFTLDIDFVIKKYFNGYK